MVRRKILSLCGTFVDLPSVTERNLQLSTQHLTITMNYKTFFNKGLCILAIITLGSPLFIFAQKTSIITTKKEYTFLPDVFYGDDQQNSFDLYLPQSNKTQVPLVVFFHGGSFRNGDKTQLIRQYPLISNLLDHDIAFASVNYRFIKDDDSLGVQKCINDAVRFIQFIRFNADEYGIDKASIGCYGESAGAGISLYLAFHDDMAEAATSDPVRKESTRVQCVGAIATQATYNLPRWKSYIPGLALVYPLVKHRLKDPLANFYGYKTYSDLKPNHKAVMSKLDMIDMISPDDPPVWLWSPTTDKIKKGIPHNANQLFHHPAHAKIIGRKAQKVKLVHFVYTSKKERSVPFSLSSFFIAYLSPTAQKQNIAK